VTQASGSEPALRSRDPGSSSQTRFCEEVASEEPPKTPHGRGAVCPRGRTSAGSAPMRRGRSAVWAGRGSDDGAGQRGRVAPFWRARRCCARAGLPFWQSGARRRGVIRGCIPKKALRCSWSMRPTVPFRLQWCKRPRRRTRASRGGRSRSSREDAGSQQRGAGSPGCSVRSLVVFGRPRRRCGLAGCAGRRSSAYGRRAPSARRPGQGFRAWGSSDGTGREVARRRGVSSLSCRRRPPA